MTVANNSLEGIENLNRHLIEQKLMEIQMQQGDSPVMKQNRSNPKLQIDLRDSAKYSN